jgi:hypothetical protein
VIGLRLSRATKRWWNSILLVSAVLSLGALYSFRFQTEAVDDFGEYVTERYVRHHRHQRRDALEALETGDTMAVRDLLEDWEPIRKGDRVYRFKRELLLRLSETLHGRNNYTEMLHWAKVWVGLDGRDITAKAYLYEGMRHNLQTHRQGVLGLENEFRRFPGNTTLAKFHADALLQSGEQLAREL